VETGAEPAANGITGAAAPAREEPVAKAGKNPAPIRIREEDWNRYVDAVRREAGRGRDAKRRKKQDEAKGARP